MFWTDTKIRLNDGPADYPIYAALDSRPGAAFIMADGAVHCGRCLRREQIYPVSCVFSPDAICRDCGEYCAESCD